MRARARTRVCEYTHVVYTYIAIFQCWIFLQRLVECYLTKIDKVVKYYG